MRQVSSHRDDQEYPLPLYLTGSALCDRLPGLRGTICAVASARASKSWLEDFFYLPMNRRHRQGIGYAFINFRDLGVAARFKEDARH